MQIKRLNLERRLILEFLNEQQVNEDRIQAELNRSLGEIGDLETRFSRSDFDEVDKTIVPVDKIFGQKFVPEAVKRGLNQPKSSFQKLQCGSLKSGFSARNQVV